MATTKSLNNNLYPPIIPTYQSANLAASAYKIYFSLSTYNTYSEISSLAQVTVRNQKTNKSALSRTLYPNEIKLCSVQIDSSKTSDDKYYIILNPSDMQNGFEINQFYKVQIRFTAAGISTPSTNALDKWLINNADSFSEWSTVSLIRGISTPTIEINGLEEDTSTILSDSDVEIVGSVVFNDSSEQDTLSKYTITLTDSNNDVVYTAEEYTGNNEDPNEINHVLKYGFTVGSTYTLTVSITTANDYSKSSSYEFLIIQSLLDALPGTFTATANDEMGCIECTLSGLTENLNENITIRRACGRDNYITWEDIHTEHISVTADQTYTWRDYTVECGIYYKYGIQRRSPRGARSSLSIIEEPVMTYFEDFFLGADGQEVRIKYNPKISSYSHVLSEGKTDTMGSQYPFIRRSGAVNYRQYSISGLITLFNDQDDIFISPEDLFQDDLERYETYRDEHWITPFNDDIYEREFRDRVVQFLYADNVKLFRSMSNGNVLVKLMNITLSPLAESLFQYLYTFSATAYEVDECSIDNYEKYGITSLGEIDDISTATQTQFGQYYGAATTSNLLTAIEEKYTAIKEGYDTSIEYLSNVSIRFNGDPYPVKQSGSNLEIITDADDIDDAIGLGYIVQVNGIDIFVPADVAQYDITGTDIQVSSLIFKQEEDVEVNYLAQLTEVESSEANQVQSYQYSIRIGQLLDTFDYGESVYSDIANKYFEKYKGSTYYQQLMSIDAIRIEANEGAVFDIQTTNDTDVTTIIINNTNVYRLKEDDITITKLIAKGIHLHQVEEDTQSAYLVANQQYYLVNGKYTAETGKALGYNHVFTSSDSSTGYYIYWAPTDSLEEFDLTNSIVECSVTALIDYKCETVKGIYNT